MLSIRTHWRNMWRNKRRTLLTVSAVALNTMVLLFMLGYVNGLFSQMIDTTCEMNLGEVQVHAPDYLLNRQLHKVVDNPQAILDAAKAQGIGAAARLYGFGLVAIGEKSNGAMIWGVDPAAEKANFRLPGYVDSGRFLADEVAKGGMPEVVLGGKLAQTLHAKIGDELLGFVQAADGSGFDTLFRVVGILKLMGESIDRTTAIIHADDFRRIFYPPSANAWYTKGGNGGTVSNPDGPGQGPDPTPPAGDPPASGFDMFNEYDPGSTTQTPTAPTIDPATWTPPFVVHEIALNTHGRLLLDDLREAVSPVTGHNEVKTWKELNVAMASIMEASKVSISFIYGIFFLLAGLSVLNTMLMATFERMREFGVLKALGTSPWRLVGDVAAEAAVLGIFSAIIGGILGAIVTSIIGYVGLDFSGVLDRGASFAGIAMDPVWRPIFRFEDLPIPVIGMAIICVIASLYPAWIAARVDPAKILHEQ